MSKINNSQAPYIPRHVLFSLDYPPLVGGISNFLSQRIRNMDGIEMSVLTPKVGGSEAVDQASAVETVRYRPYFAKVKIVRRMSEFSQGILNLIKTRRGDRFDVLESGTALPGSFYGWVFKKFFPLKTITFVHGNDFLRSKKNFLTAWMLRNGLRSSDLIVANSNFTADLVRSLGVNDKSIVVINPPVDTERFNPEEDCGFVRDRHGLTGKDVLMTVSRLYKGRKGFGTLFEALKILRKKHQSMALLIVGSGSAREQLESQVREEGLEDMVIFAGYVDDDELPAYYCAADIFVMVSDFDRSSGDVEGYGIVYDEAHACETPCIAANVGGAPEAVMDQQDGLVVPPGDSVALAGAIEELLLDRERSRELGGNGRQRLLSKDYAWEELNNLGKEQN